MGSIVGFPATKGDVRAYHQRLPVAIFVQDVCDAVKTRQENAVLSVAVKGVGKVVGADGVTVTGATVIAEKGFTYGDANDDGTINLSDVTVVLQQVAKWENVKINLDAADVNADGNLNLSDVTLLLQYIAKWDVTLGPKA